MGADERTIKNRKIHLFSDSPGALSSGGCEHLGLVRWGVLNSGVRGSHVMEVWMILEKRLSANGGG